MRIAIVCPYSIDIPGGVQTQAIAAARKFGQRGHEVLLLAPGSGSQFVGSGSQCAGIKSTVNFASLGKTMGIRANGSIAPVCLSPSVLLKLQAAFHRHRPDVVVVHEPFVPVVSIAALFVSPVACVGVFHRSGVTPAYRLLRPLAAILSRRIRQGVVVSEEARSTLRYILKGRVDSYELIANAIDLDRFPKILAPTNSTTTVVFLGRHEHRKGLVVLLRALGELDEDFRLWIIGSGPETTQLKRDYQEEPRVSWLGRLSDTEVAERLMAADIFVAPSLSGESFGVVLLEAMGAGSAVLCSDLPGYRLAAGNAALFVPAGDVASLAAGLRSLLTDQPLRLKLIERGSEQAQKYGVEAQVERYERLFQDILPS